MCVNNVSYEKLFIGNGFWVMPRQCQNMLCKGRVKRANLYLKAICSAFIHEFEIRAFWVMPEQCQSMLCKGRAKRANPYLLAIFRPTL